MTTANYYVSSGKLRHAGLEKSSGNALLSISGQYSSRVEVVATGAMITVSLFTRHS